MTGPVEQGILEQLGTISSVLQAPSTGDESIYNIGQIVACQHRTLNPEQRSIYLQGIQQAYMTALQYSSCLYASQTRVSDEHVFRQL